MKKLCALLILIITLFTSPVSARTVIKSRINGIFEGFEEGKVFELLNGHIWIQTDYRLRVCVLAMPEVIIYSKGGRYYMKVKGVEDVVRVEQLD